MQIWICDENGENLAQLTNSDSEPSGTPRWSPDGRWIAFDHRSNQGWRIFVMATDGGRVRRLTADAGEEIIPSWSADGRWIYYACDRSGRFEIWKTPAEGGKAVQVTRGGGTVPFESPDGHTLYYIRNDSALWALPLRGGEEKRVLEFVWNRSFAVKEDGIYYIPPPQAGVTQVRFHRFTTNEDREIATVRQYPNQGLTVSPDRKSILFPALKQPAGNVMIVDNFK
jgi:eukaryotic-like serine/threonine-protein kinase